MSLVYLLFIIYFLSACFILYRSSLIRRSCLPALHWIIFFILKTGAGCYYGYWYSRPATIAGSDSWRFHQQALLEYRLLLSNPGGYLSGLFQNSYGDWGGMLSTTSYWNDLKDNLMTKIVAVMHVMSGAHYYVNVVIFSFLTLFGYVFFYKACRNVLHRDPGPLTTAIILLAPSCLFWTSGLHRDGFMLLFAGMFLWQLTLLQRKRNIRWRDPVLLVLSFTGLFIFRNYVAILLLPPVMAWLICTIFTSRPALIFPATILFFAAAVFLLPRPSLPAKLIERKAAFEALDARSALPPLVLSPNFSSFARNLPKAIERALFMPYIWEAHHGMEKLAAIESVLILAMCLAALFCRPGPLHADAARFQWMMIVFCLGIFILIGYTVPVLGAIVRYRAMFLMFLATVVSFNFPDVHQKIFNMLNIESKFKKNKTR